MSEPQDAIQDLMNNNGFDEAEARAYYHLYQAKKAYKAMVITKDDDSGDEAFLFFFLPLFNTLENEIIRWAWEREHLARKRKE